MEYMRNVRNIHKYLRYEIIRNTGAAFGGAQMGRPPHGIVGQILGFWVKIMCFLSFSRKNRAESFRNFFEN